MTEQDDTPYGPYQNDDSAAKAQGEAGKSPNYQTEAQAEQNPHGQVPSTPQQGAGAHPGSQVSDSAAQQPAPSQFGPSTQQQAPGYGQPNSGQQAPGYGQPGAYNTSGYGQAGPTQQGFGVPTFDAYGNQIPSDAMSLALFAHLSSLIGLVVTGGCLNFIGPLIFWFIYKDKPGYQFVRHAAAGAFNFSFTMWIINVSSVILTFLTLGIAGFFTLIIILAACVALIVFHIIASVKANNGEIYNYPMAIKILS